MEKNVEISILCELYKKMLTEKQYAFLDDYYNNDLSLSEISENNNITRQAVRDVIKQGENKLYELENNLEFMKKMQEQEKEIASIKKNIEKLEKNETDIEKLKILAKVKDKISNLI